MPPSSKKYSLIDEDVSPHPTQRQLLDVSPRSGVRSTTWPWPRRARPRCDRPMWSSAPASRRAGRPCWRPCIRRTGGCWVLGAGPWGSWVGRVTKHNEILRSEMGVTRIFAVLMASFWELSKLPKIIQQVQGRSRSIWYLLVMGETWRDFLKGLLTGIKIILGVVMKTRNKNIED